MTEAGGVYVQPQRAMDSSAYLDHEVFAAELQTVLANTWQFACHSSELAEPGDYVAYEIAGESLFTVCDGEGLIRTFYNVCLQRLPASRTRTGCRCRLPQVDRVSVSRLVVSARWRTAPGTARRRPSRVRCE